MHFLFPLSQDPYSVLLWGEANSVGWQQWDCCNSTAPGPVSSKTEYSCRNKHRCTADRNRSPTGQHRHQQHQQPPSLNTQPAQFLPFGSQSPQLLLHGCTGPWGSQSCASGGWRPYREAQTHRPCLVSDMTRFECWPVTYLQASVFCYPFTPLFSPHLINPKLGDSLPFPPFGTTLKHPSLV